MSKPQFYLYSIILSLGALFLFSACNAQSSSRPAPSTEELEFVTTPIPGGVPQFLNTPEASTIGGAAYPVPSENSVEVESYPAPTSSYSKDGRRQTALASYDLAVAVALEEFHSDAYLAAIPPSSIMLINLGNPPVLPGWFFKFKKPDSRREFIVHVADTIVTGTTLTESVADVGPKELAIDVTKARLDSTQVLEKFAVVATARGLPLDVSYDLELVDLEGGSGLTWSVVDPVTHAWLYSVNAVTGEEVRNPYGQ